MEFDSKKYYNKALTKIVLNQLKEFGFKKFKTSHIARIENNEILQLINFQKSKYGDDSFTVNISVRPLYIKQEDIILEPGGRLGEFETGKDTWWRTDTEKETNESFQEITKIIIDKVLPWFDKNNSSQKIIEYQQSLTAKKSILKFNRKKKSHTPIWKPDDFGFVALKQGEYYLAKQNFETTINQLKDKQDISWCRKKTNDFRNIIELIDKDNLDDISTLLQTNMVETINNLKLSKIQ